MTVEFVGLLLVYGLAVAFVGFFTRLILDDAKSCP